MKDLKESLMKISSSSSSTTKNNNNDDEQILDILHNLNQYPIDVNILAETLIGATVSKLKHNSNNDIALKAKQLVKKWKQTAKASGIGNSNTASSGGDNDVKSTSSSSTNNNGPSKSVTTTTAKTTAPATTSNSNNNNNNNNNGSIQALFDHLPDFRKNSVMKLYDTFMLSKSTLLQQAMNNNDNNNNNNDDNNDSESKIMNQIITKAQEVEEAIQSYSKGNRKAYIDKIRSLIFNLKKNHPLRHDVITGNKSTTPQKLVTMSSKELQTVEKAKEQEEQVASLHGSRRLDWEQANAEKVNEMCGIKGELLKASLFTCGRCKSHKTTSTQKQTRSADEPMTVFVFCENCGNRWKC